ncbi:hypothetical protein EYC98_21135 [Halieaceae bacterium IMCC14734]|uniref:Outer membrane protein beta-barrel domain-containing protein n=1 Tax=Candidatus Litorirhabdus singularis TaxID=2518993 RepID=A0ABT3TM26_9GAMM|nr:hypothetical protein [Candidatus Litorirhabdus singularis]MCX2983373.1 hypothetical protein [Candidatus Litorirhabdus singularis]
MYVKLFLLILVLTSKTALAAGDIPYHHLAVVLAGGVEKKSDHDENTSMAGLEYEYRFSAKLGIGAVYEELGEDAVRNQAVILPLSIHPGGHWRIFTGPGYEWHGSKEKYLWRLGGGYEFNIGGHWSLAPEASVDMIENGDSTWLLGLALGYHF